MKYIHIAGTNAKGSVANFISNILSVKNKCGVFTSPHLFSPLERMCINQTPISQKDYDYYTNNAQAVGKHMFAVWTDAALQWFEDQCVEYAVMETGLGGRKDPTNTVDSCIQILTPISFDHTNILGDTLLKIAHEKCGIIKYNSKVITFSQPPEVMRLIEQTCKGKKCELFTLNTNDIKLISFSKEEQIFNFCFDGSIYKDIKINFMSPSQVNNACAAIIVAKILDIPILEIREGLGLAKNLARCQYIDDALIDGCHNVQSFLELKKTLEIYFTKKTTVVLALMEDKNISEIVAIVKSFAYNVIVCCANSKRGLSAKELAKHFDCPHIIADPHDAYTYAKNIAKNSTVVVCGSFYLCSHILKMLENYNN